MNVLKLLNPIGWLVSYVTFKIDRLRLMKLVSRGLKVGKNVYIMEGVDFDYTFPYLIEIGDNCRISKGVRILAHDASVFRDLGVTRIAPVKILEGTFIGERAIILPGVTIGPRALVAAGSFVNRDIGKRAVVAGNPARPYGKYSDLLMKYRQLAGSGTVLKKEDMEEGRVTQKDLVRALQEQPVVFLRGVPRKDPFYINADYAEMRASALQAYERLKSQPPSTETDSSQSAEQRARSVPTRAVNLDERGGE